MKRDGMNAFGLVCRAPAVAAVVGVTLIALAQPARATMQFFQETGKSCAECHQDPAGGPELTPLGKQFQENGNKLPAAAQQPPPKSPQQH